MKAKRHLAAFMAAAMVLTIPAGSFAAKNQQLNEATFSDPIDFNPVMGNDSASSDVYTKCFVGLYDRDMNLKIVPIMADGMPKIAADNKTITVKMKKDFKWHDGKPVTSADVKFSFEFIKDPVVASPRLADLKSVASIEAPDPYTVVFKMTEPDSSFIDTLLNPYVIPKHIWEGVDRKDVKASEYNKTKIVGNGPWKLLEKKAGERVVLERNANYAGKEKPQIQKYIFSVTPSQAVMMVKAETGESDLVKVPESDIVRMQKSPKLNMAVYDRLAFDCIQYNLDPKKSPFFTDKKVRQAFAHAINKNTIVRGIYKGLASPAYSTYHPKTETYNKSVKQYAYDINKAKQLLDQAGWKMGPNGIRVKDGKEFKFKLITNKGNVMREKVIVEVQRQLKPLGIQADTLILEWNTFLSKYKNPGNFDATMGGFTTGMKADTTYFYHSDRALSPGNAGKYANTEVDKLLEEGKRTMDAAKAKPIYDKIQNIIAEDQPYLFIAYRKEGTAFTKNLTGLKFVDLLGHNGQWQNYSITN